VSSHNLNHTHAHTSGIRVLSWGITPPLPTGMLFNTTDGEIKGRPTHVTGSTLYTVSATNTGGRFCVYVWCVCMKASHVFVRVCDCVYYMLCTPFYTQLRSHTFFLTLSHTHFLMLACSSLTSTLYHTHSHTHSHRHWCLQHGHQCGRHSPD